MHKWINDLQEIPVVRMSPVNDQNHHASTNGHAKFVKHIRLPQKHKSKSSHENRVRFFEIARQGRSWVSGSFCFSLVCSGICIWCDQMRRWPIKRCRSRASCPWRSLQHHWRQKEFSLSRHKNKDGHLGGSWTFLNSCSAIVCESASLGETAFRHPH